MNKNKERQGFLIFFISTLIVTQLRWCDKFDYDDIEQRLAVVIFISVLLYWGLGKWLDIFEGKTENDKWQRVITDASYTLSFSFLFVAFYKNNEQIGGVIVFLSLVYLVKSNDKALEWLVSFKNSNNFEVELDETKEMPVLNIKGKHDTNNLVSFQYLCVDLSENFFKMKNKKFKEVQLDLQITNNSNEQIMPLIQAIANIHAVTLKSENITTA